MAELLSTFTGRRVPITTVQYWSEQGYVPSKRQSEVLACARENGIEIALDDFCAPEPEARAS